MKRKIWLILFLLPLLVLAFPKTSLAQSEAMIQFRLHKLIGTNEQSENIGILNNEQGINGASFAVYDVTNAFYQLREKGFDLEEAQQIIARQGTPAGDFIMEKITRTVDNEEGVAVFDLPEKEQEKDKVYLFVETSEGLPDSDPTQNMVVVLPIYDEKGQKQTTVHLYPKTTQPSSSLVFEKKLAEKVDNFSIGDTIRYSLKLQLPDRLSNEETCVISDHADQELAFLPATLEVLVAGEKMQEFTVHNQENGFSLVFAKDKLASLAGQTVNIKYQMQLKKEAIADQAIYNHAILDIGEDSISQTTHIRTGGKWFQKVASNNERQPLEGAAFLVKNQNGEYLHLIDGVYHWEKKAKDALTLTSNASGLFSVNGLKDGDYQLEEIKAPAGYVKNQSSISFTVKSMSYAVDGQQSDPLKIGNKEKNQSLFFPKTNEQKAAYFVIGIVIVLGCISILIKEREKNNETKNEQN